MALRVRYLSGKKGSNPGGKVHISEEVVRQSHIQGFDAYLKFCWIPEQLHGTSFTASHQPVYEAATFELAKWFGLHVPNFYVLLNDRRDVAFEGWREVGEKDPHGRRYYFVSRWLTCPLDDEDRRRKPSEASRIVNEEESFYLDTLHVSDIKGKRHNYVLCDEVYGSPSVYYVDLGCSFVKAVGGRLIRPVRVKGITTNHEWHNTEKQLQRYGLITADEDTIIPLENLPLAIQNMTLPTLNPRGRAALSDLVNKAELQEMERDIIYTASKNLHKLRKLDVLINCNSH